MSGVKIIQSAADLTALKAIAGAVAGQLCLVSGEGIFRAETTTSATNETVSAWVVHADDASVKWVKIRSGFRETGNTSTLTSLVPLHDNELVLARSGLGLYRYSAGSSSTADGLHVVTSAAGRWFRLGSDLITTTGGAGGDQRRLDPTKLATPNRIVSVTEQAVAGPFTFSPTSSTPGQAFGTGLSLAVETGDIVLIEVNLGKIIDQGNELTLLIRSGTTVLGNGIATLPASASSAPRHVAWKTRYVAPSNATLSLQCGGICASASSVEVTSYQLIATLIRP